MKNILTLAIIVLILASCKSRNKKEKEIFDFLNHTAKQFSKDKYELVSLEFKDSVYVPDYQNFHSKNDFIDYAKDLIPVTLEIDTVVFDEKYQTAIEDETKLVGNKNFYSDINWYNYPFSEKLYNLICDDGGKYLYANRVQIIF